MKEEKGQALIEFILILPVFLLIISAFIDVLNIMYEKYKLNQNLDTIATIFIEKGDTSASNYANENKIDWSFKKEDDIYIVEVSKKHSFFTPGLNKAFKKSTVLKEEKTVYPKITDEPLNNNEPGEI